MKISEILATHPVIAVTGSMAIALYDPTAVSVTNKTVGATLSQVATYIGSVPLPFLALGTSPPITGAVRIDATSFGGLLVNALSGANNVIFGATATIGYIGSITANEFQFYYNNAGILAYNNTQFYPVTHNTVDIGKTGTRFKNFYFAGNGDITGTLLVTGAITSGLINGQTISSIANFTGSVAIATTLGVTGLSTLGLVTSGLINGQTISSVANFTGSVAIATTLGVTGLSTLGLVTSGLINGQTITSAANFTGTVGITGILTLAAALTFSTAAGIVIPGATSLAFRNTANTFTNLLLADGGTITTRGILNFAAPDQVNFAGANLQYSSATSWNSSGVSGLFLEPQNANLMLFGYDPGGANIHILGWSTNLGGSVSLLRTGQVTGTATLALVASPRIGTVTVGNGSNGARLIVGALSDGATESLIVFTGARLRSGNFYIDTTVSKIIPGVTSLSLRNNADTFDNLLITDAGAITSRGSLTIAGALSGVTTLTTSGLINGQKIDAAANFTGTAGFSGGVTASNANATLSSANASLFVNGGANQTKYAGVYFAGFAVYDSFFGRIPQALGGVDDAIGYVTSTGAPVLHASFTASLINFITDFSVATNKFTVASVTGNTAVAGTLAVAGAVTFASTISTTLLNLPNTGAAATSGTLTLIAGTKTINTTAMTATALLFVQRRTSGGTVGFATTYTRVNATSFTLNSDNALDTSTFDWWIVEVH